MEKSLIRVSLYVLICSCVGCTQLQTMSVPFQGAKPEYKDQYGPTPAEQVGRLETMAYSAASMSETDQATRCTELSGLFDEVNDPIIRRQVVRTLGGFSSNAALPVLHRASEDSDPKVRIAACEAWGRRNTRESLPALATIFELDEDTNVRLASSRELGRLKNPAAVQHLAKGLEDRSPAVQYASIQALRRITGATLGNDVNKWNNYVATLNSTQATDSPATQTATPFGDLLSR